MKFVDVSRLFLASGKGGDGCVAFTREKFLQHGGPSGGNGGMGGCVLFQGNAGKTTLFDLACNPHQKAGNGKHGSGKNKNGAKGEDKLILVPLGTSIFDDEKNELLMEVVDEVPKVLLEGGRGGKGNRHFKSSVRRAPRFATDGETGMELTVRLELKLIADVGLIGFPNAGKSSFVAAVSGARPKVADYPFTTLVPNLGVVSTADYGSFVIADIPGIIEGAHLGAGLGLRFLRHIQRTSVLAFLLDVSVHSKREPSEAFSLLLDELKRHSSQLELKPKIVLLTKIDILRPEWNLETLLEEMKARGIVALPISSANRSGLDEASRKLFEMVLEERSDATSVDTLPYP